MKRRLRAAVPVLALLAVAVLVFRPAMLDVIDSPFGAHFSPQVQLAYAEGSPHCGLLADCETVSISNAGLDLTVTGFMLALAGVVMAVTASRARILHSWTALVPNPPPLRPLP